MAYPSAEYLAATLDMEGTLGIYNQKKGWGPLLQAAPIHNCEWEMVSQVGSALLDNGIYPQIGESGNQKRNPAHRICWRLRINEYAQIKRYLELVMPYMRSKVKLAKAEEMLAYINRSKRVAISHINRRQF